MEVSLQRTIGRDQHIHAKVVLLPAYEVGLFDVATDYVAFLEVRLLEVLDPGDVSPLFELCELIHQEDTFALRPIGWLHDPGDFGASFKLFLEQVVILRKLIGQGHDV